MKLYSNVPFLRLLKLFVDQIQDKNSGSISERSSQGGERDLATVPSLTFSVSLYSLIN